MPINGRIRYQSAVKTVTTTLTSVATAVSTETLTKNAHGLQNGQQVTLASIVNTTGISTSTTYIIVQATTNTFKLALTVDGTPVNLTGTDGTCSVIQSNIVTVLNSIRPINSSTASHKVEINPATFAVIITDLADDSVVATASPENLNLSKIAAKNALIDLGCQFAIDNSKH